MRERKIPTLLGLALVAVAVIIFRLAFDRIGPLLTKASETGEPSNVSITNISDSSFTVSWITTKPSRGSIRIDGATYYDERESVAQYSTHSVTVRNLKPDTAYSFRILNDSYTARTAQTITGIGTSLEPAYGQLTAPSGEPIEGALVYLTLEGAQTLSTLSKSSGTWVIPLNLARSQDLARYIEGPSRIDESILVRTAQGESSALTDTLNDNPVPVMIMGKTYDFRKVQAAAPPSVLGTSTQTAKHSVSITKPAQGSAIPSNLPLIQGTAIPGNQVLVVVGIDNPVTDTVIVGQDGIFRYTPPKPLSEGKQSVTITTPDTNGKPKAITHMFEVLKSGTQVLGEATPSATLEPTMAQSPTPTSTLAGEPIPETGYPLPLILLLILGFGLLSGGLTQAFLMK